MVYGYETNKEFIDKSYQLLEKFDKKHLWNKDTLVIGIDKSVRPLVYTLRKLSREEGREIPNIMFFNYHGGTFYDVKKKINSIKKDLKSKLDKYNNFIILDEHILRGHTLRESKLLLDEILSSKKLINFKTQKKNIYLAVLGTIRGESYLSTDRDKFIFVDPDIKNVKAQDFETGLKEGSKEKESLSYSMGIKGSRFPFIQNRKQLSSDIIKYLHEKHPDNVNKHSSLERAIQTVSIISLIFGIFISYKSITGNVVGESPFTNFYGIILILLATGGFFLSRKVRK